ncbi:MAG: zinc ribbon domain-containing protein [Phycisphaerales bacterium]|nr:zinc ribbon domain-containing protein [Phycisphaerales bacterium]
MPIYEYTCQADGSTIELLRPMSEADKPVEDPEGRGRTFTRVHSTFAAQGAGTDPKGRSHSIGGGCCPCGKSHGGCSKP